MINKGFDDIDGDDIKQLVADARVERRTLDYKQELPKLGLEQDKYEFLFDISSFANTSGGDIVYGVVDKRDADGKPTGIPESCPGVTAGNPDALMLQLQQVVRANIDPRVPGIQMKPIPGFANGPVVVVRIPKSYIGPHMVKNQKDWGRFYMRTSNGKYILDVGEVRAAFALSETLAERISTFRGDRLAKVKAGQTPFIVGPGPWTVLHLLPVASLDPTTHVDVAACEHKRVWPIYASSVDWRFNFDGLVFYRPPTPPDPCPTYVQLFRKGTSRPSRGG